MGAKKHIEQKLSHELNSLSLSAEIIFVDKRSDCEAGLLAGFDNSPPAEASGHRCLICKRDLSFAPEGLVLQPGNLPPVAVLPCGHKFHGQCLQNITPEDQAHDPPCIPCAIDET